MSGPFTNVLKIEIDGHFHGSAEVPKPWAAEIGGPCPKYGLQRKFLRAMQDWSGASRACSGNIYGRVVRYMLREGVLYEVCRLRGNRSKRYISREFVVVEGGKRRQLEPAEALERVVGPGTELRVPDDREGTSWVARVRGLGMPERQGFAVVGTQRLYLVPDGLYEVMSRGDVHFVGVQAGRVIRLNHEEALQWLRDGRH